MNRTLTENNVNSDIVKKLANQIEPDKASLNTKTERNSDLSRCPRIRYDDDVKVRLPFIFLLLIVLIGAILRIWAATDNFWLDEVATYHLANSVDTPMEVITRIRTDHHILNTVYMNILGIRFHWGAYRLLSVITGIAAVLLMARDASARGSFECFTVSILAAISYPLINYSSEARGYAPAICFSLAAYLLLQAGWKNRLLFPRVLFSFFMFLAILSHITAIYPLAGMSIWVMHRASKAARARSPEFSFRLIDGALTLLPSYVLVAAVYFFIMRNSTSMGGDVIPLSRVLKETLAYLVGSPVSPPWIYAGTTLAALALVWAFASVYASDMGRFLFYVVTIVIFPAITLLLYSREYLYPRYFIICFPYVFLLFAEALRHLHTKSRPGRFLAVILIALFTTGNTINTIRLLKTGRGGYFKALQMACDHSPGRRVTISGDHDFRVGMMVNYYARFFREQKDVIYIPSGYIPEYGTDWYISHQTDQDLPVPNDLSLGKWKYQKIHIFNYYGLSGMQWNLYIRSEPLDP